MDEPTTTAAGGLLAKGLASIGFGATGALIMAAFDPPKTRRTLFWQALAYAATFACDLGLGNRVQVGTLTGNITHSSPTNVPRSQTEVTYEFTQDDPGGRTITWSSLHKGAWPTASGTANQKMLVTGVSNGTQIIFKGSSGWYS